MQYLQPNTLLQGGRYKIIETLGQGGFGITYLAIQSGLERKVAVKEFFMKELCNRDEATDHVTIGTDGSRETVNRFREKFLKEARNIARLNHPNIVRIIDVFEENGTAYYVMEYAENGSLADKVKREGYLSESVATRYILQIAEALDYIHQRKMNHLDVKPANIMLNEKDEALLIDFGLSKRYDAKTGDATSTNIAGLSEGYAPLEQYDGSIKSFAPEIDVYALGATFFKMLTGNTPPAASSVNNDGLPTEELRAKGVSDNVIIAITNAMQGRKMDRTKTIKELTTSLFCHTTSTLTTHAFTDDVEIESLPNANKKEDTLTEKSGDSDTPSASPVSHSFIEIDNEETNLHTKSKIQDNEEEQEVERLVESIFGGFSKETLVVLFLSCTVLAYFYYDYIDFTYTDSKGTIPSAVIHWLSVSFGFTSALTYLWGIGIYTLGIEAYTRINTPKLYGIIFSSVLIAVIIYAFILGNPSNFQGGDNLNAPLPGNLLGSLYKYPFSSLYNSSISILSIFVFVRKYKLITEVDE